MTFMDQILNFFVDFSKIIFSLIFFLILALFIIVFHIFAYFIRDKKHIKHFRNIKELKMISQNDLNEFPTVNIIVPAWKEGEIFRGTLEAIKNLKYPKYRVIVNAGGNEKTIQIAESFKEFDNFTILRQKSGEGKIKAINDCLAQVSNGIVFLIDADVYLNDNLLINMIYPLINENEFVVVSGLKPHNSIKNNDLVKFLFINRNPRFRRKLTRYIDIIGPSTALRYDVIKKINRFTKGKFSDDGRVIGKDLRKKKFKIYFIPEYLGETYNYPTSIKTYIRQNLRWIENAFFRKLEEKKRFFLIKFLAIFLISIYLFIFPIFYFFNPALFLIGIFIFISFYIKKIRKLIFFQLTKDNSLDFNFNFLFFIKMLFYIYIEILMNIIAFFELIFFRKKNKKRKNLI